MEEDPNADIILNGSSNGICNGNGVMPERRHSSTEGSRSSKGEVRVTVNRRHSLPGDRGSAASDGVALEIHGRDVSPESVEVSCPSPQANMIVKCISVADTNARDK